MLRERERKGRSRSSFWKNFAFSRTSWGPLKIYKASCDTVKIKTNYTKTIINLKSHPYHRHKLHERTTVWSLFQEGCNFEALPQPICLKFGHQTDCPPHNQLLLKNVQLPAKPESESNLNQKCPFKENYSK